MEVELNILLIKCSNGVLENKTASIVVLRTKQGKQVHYYQEWGEEQCVVGQVAGYGPKTLRTRHDMCKRDFQNTRRDRCYEIFYDYLNIRKNSTTISSKKPTLFNRLSVAIT